ncbi:MAG: DUF1499 domain-containing protein [Proteobacteria bacterium]|nr:DUF1499 domain-containing protein [Pseudomonadota bacterium]
MNRLTVCTVFAILALACQGTRPQNLGVIDGSLSACPDKPNCVSSQASNEKQKLSSLPLKGSALDSIKRLTELIEAMPHAKIIEKRDHYLYAEFESSLFHFVDDLEFWVSDKTQEIHLKNL